MTLLPWIVQAAVTVRIVILPLDHTKCLPGRAPFAGTGRAPETSGACVCLCDSIHSPHPTRDFKVVDDALESLHHPGVAFAAATRLGDKQKLSWAIFRGISTGPLS